MQDCSYSSVSALYLLQSYAEPIIVYDANAKLSCSKSTPYQHLTHDTLGPDSI